MSETVAKNVYPHSLCCHACLCMYAGLVSHYLSCVYIQLSMIMSSRMKKKVPCIA
jgi:hypothetical protein